MNNICRTIYGANIQTGQYIDRPITIHPNSTLNQKFDIQQHTTLNQADRLAMRYVGIGNGGHKVVTGADGIAKLEIVQHTARHAGLYNQLPYVLRLPTNDLPSLERAKYRLRRLEQHHGATYVAYYLKTLDLSNVTPSLELRTVTNGIVTSSPFTPTLSDLSPTPPALLPNQVITTTGDYLASTAKINFSLTPSDIVEFKEVCNIIYGDEGYAIVSEIALCSGADRVVSGDFNGTMATYTEAIAVQIANHVNTFFSAVFNNTGINMTFDVGNVEPLLTLSTVTLP